jgi:hypothetical protein
MAVAEAYRRAVFPRTRDVRAYVGHGPPQLAMRLLAPLFVVATVVLFGSVHAEQDGRDLECDRNEQQHSHRRRQAFVSVGVHPVPI